MAGPAEATAGPAIGPDSDGVDRSGAAATVAPAPSAATAGRIDVISDAICPWCFIGKRHMEGALARLAPEGLRFDVHWRPFQLNPEMPRAGAERVAWRRAKFGSDARAEELDARVTAAAASAGIAMRLDRIGRTPNTLDAHRLVWLAEAEGAQDAVVEALFTAYFIEGRDIGDRAELAAIGAGAGLDGAAVARRLEGSDGEREVRREDRAARRAGLQGVPTFTLDSHILFSGAVPADTVAEALRSAWRVLHGGATRSA
ncbi:MAG TPA: DsbA family oxidoreductase [Acetobacteraceae bacterium]|nr:DsbA family oxidoreductase [Acetobacteraceae bacterium]